MDWRTEVTDKLDDPDGSDVATVDPNRTNKVLDMLESVAALMAGAVEEIDGLPALRQRVQWAIEDPQARPWLDRMIAGELATLRQAAGDDAEKLERVTAVERAATEAIRRS
jgi:hypothetical protein